MKIGIVGLPNVGKSTLFKALTKKEVNISNYPFCTIDPNVGIVEVPDERLVKLAKLYNSKKVISAVIEFVDIAGLVKNASKGEGLGNQFLSHIREVDAIIHIVRNFEDSNIIHIGGKVDPVDDLKTVVTELAIADLSLLEKFLQKIAGKLKLKDKAAGVQKNIIENLISDLNKGIKSNISNFSNEDQKFIKNLHLLSLKPELFVENVAEEKLQNFKSTIPNSIPICAKLEADLVEFSTEDTQKYLKEFDIDKSGLNKIILASYKLLNLITFFTINSTEAHAWTIREGTRAPQAAGKVHTDFEKGFIRAETINWQKLLEIGSETKAKEKGIMRSEGKDYIVQDGDVILFRFNR